MLCTGIGSATLTFRKRHPRTAGTTGTHPGVPVFTTRATPLPFVACPLHGSASLVGGETRRTRSVERGCRPQRAASRQTILRQIHA